MVALSCIVIAGLLGSPQLVCAAGPDRSSGDESRASSRLRNVREGTIAVVGKRLSATRRLFKAVVEDPAQAGAATVRTTGRGLRRLGEGLRYALGSESMRGVGVEFGLLGVANVAHYIASVSAVGYLRSRDKREQDRREGREPGPALNWGPNALLPVVPGVLNASVHVLRINGAGGGLGWTGAHVLGDPKMWVARLGAEDQAEVFVGRFAGRGSLVGCVVPLSPLALVGLKKAFLVGVFSDRLDPFVDWAGPAMLRLKSKAGAFNERLPEWYQTSRWRKAVSKKAAQIIGKLGPGDRDAFIPTPKRLRDASGQLARFTLYPMMDVTTTAVGVATETVTRPLIWLGERLEQ